MIVLFDNKKYIKLYIYSIHYTGRKLQIVAIFKILIIPNYNTYKNLKNVLAPRVKGLQKTTSGKMT